MSPGSERQPIHAESKPLTSLIGTVITICGAALSLLSFFALPYVSVLTPFSAVSATSAERIAIPGTGAELAVLDEGILSLVGVDSGSEWLVLLWLIPIAAVAALIIAILMRNASSALRKALATALIGIGVAIAVDISAAFSAFASEVNSYQTTSGTKVVTGLGFWLTIVGAATIAVGGVVRLVTRSTIGLGGEPK